MTESEQKDLAQQQWAVGGPRPGDVYRHYKGGLYVIVGRSIKKDTLDPLVTYRSNAKGTYWTRTLANFTEEVEVPIGCSPAPRFQREED